MWAQGLPTELAGLVCVWNATWIESPSVSEWDPSKLIQNADFDSTTCERGWVVLSVMFALHGRRRGWWRVTQMLAFLGAQGPHAKRLVVASDTSSLLSLSWASLPCSGAGFLADTTAAMPPRECPRLDFCLVAYVRTFDYMFVLRQHERQALEQI